MRMNLDSIVAFGSLVLLVIDLDFAFFLHGFLISDILILCIPVNRVLGLDIKKSLNFACFLDGKGKFCYHDQDNYYNFP